MFPYSFFCFKIFVINTGSEGLDLVDFLKVPETTQKVLQYVRESKIATLEKLKPPKNPDNYINKPGKTNNSLTTCAAFWARSDPVFGVHSHSVKIFQSLEKAFQIFVDMSYLMNFQDSPLIPK